MGEAFTLSNTIDMKKLKPKDDEILIGWYSGIPHAESGEDVAEIARKLTYGAGPQTWTKLLGGKTQTFHVTHVEARPVVQDGMEAGKEEVKGRIAKYFEKKTAGENVNSALNEIGAACVAVVRKFAIMGNYKSSKPNLPAWSAMKQGSPPWIDTGQVMDTLTYVTHEGIAKNPGSE